MTPWHTRVCLSLALLPRVDPLLRVRGPSLGRVRGAAARLAEVGGVDPRLRRRRARRGRVAPRRRRRLAAEAPAEDPEDPLPSPREAFAAKTPPSATTAASAPADPPLSFFLAAFLAAFLEADALGAEEDDALGAGAALPSFLFLSASASVPAKRDLEARCGSTFWYSADASNAGEVVASASGTAPASSDSDAAPATASFSAGGRELESADAAARGAAAEARVCVRVKTCGGCGRGQTLRFFSRRVCLSVGRRSRRASPHV